MRSLSSATPGLPLEGADDGRAGSATDSDVSAGFPVKRLVLMIVYANMICIGGAFAAMMAFGIYQMLEFALLGHYPGYGSGGFLGFFQMYGSGIEQLWGFATDDLAQTARFIFLAIIPGTIGGIVWYLILRWRESVILKKRLRAAKAKARTTQLLVAQA